MESSRGLDPDFAMAHAALGQAYYMSQSPRDRQQGEAHFVRALALIDRLSHRERLWQARAGRMAQARATLTLMSKTAGERFETILARREFGNESQEQWFNAQIRLAEIYVQLGRLDEARALCDGFVARWTGADDDLLLLQDARKVLAGLK
jgi:tetratricopeptide (TPR) repeat protein